MAKNIDDLMKHLRDKHNISISGSSQKRELRNIGYFHGYKGYRFIKNNPARISFTNFDEILTFIEKIFSLAQINNSPLGATIRGRSLMFSYRNNGFHVNNNKIIRHAKFGNEVYFKTGT